MTARMLVGSLNADACPIDVWIGVSTLISIHDDVIVGRKVPGAGS